MSGIAATFVLAGAAADDTRHRLMGLLGQLSHRGDPPRVVVGPLGGVGQRTRATLPEDTDGPFVDGELSLAADLRLDNREALCHALGVAEHVCDAAVVVAAYRRWGEGAPARLRGDFAFILLDSERRRLFCARDPFGARPLYYHHRSNVFWCASEPGALVAQPEIPRRPNLLQVASVLGQAYSESHDTLFEDVFSLTGGHQLTVDASGYRLQRYWGPDPWKRCEVDDDTAAAMVRSAITAAVKRRVRSSKRVAVFLSGGLDSAIVAGETERLRREGWGPREKPVLVHAAFPDNVEDETGYSDDVACMWELPHVNARVVGDAACFQPSRLDPIDIPYDPRNGMWGQLYAETSSEGAAAGLTGDGVDECLRPTGVEWADALQRGRFDVIARESEIAIRPWSLRSWTRAVQHSVQPLLPAPISDSLQSLRPHAVLSRRAATRLIDHERAQRAKRAGRTYPSLVARELCAHFEEGWYHAAVATNERIAARHGIELRNGLFDVELVELLLSLSHHQRHVHGLDKPKPVLRAAAASLVPTSVLHRADSGSYGKFFERVLFGHHHPALRTLLSTGHLARAGLVRPAVVERLTAGDTATPPKLGRASWLLHVAGLVAMENFLGQL